MKYQARLIRVFDSLAASYDIEMIDATRTADEIFHELQGSIGRLFTPVKKVSQIASGKGRPPGKPARKRA